MFEVLTAAESTVKLLGESINISGVFFQMSPLPVDIYDELLKLSGAQFTNYNKTFAIQNANKEKLFIQFIGNSMKVGSSLQSWT